AVAAHAVRRRVEQLRVLRVHRQIDEAGILVDELHLRPGLAAVGGLVDAALLVRRPEVAQRRDVHDVGVLRVDDDAADVARLLETDVLPGLAAVGGLVHAVAPRDAVARVVLAGADPHDVGVGRRHRDGTDAQGRLVVEDRLPAVAAVGGLPDAAGRGAEVDRLGVALPARVLDADVVQLGPPP